MMIVSFRCSMHGGGGMIPEAHREGFGDPAEEYPDELRFPSEIAPTGNGARSWGVLWCSSGMLCFRDIGGEDIVTDNVGMTIAWLHISSS